MVSVKEHIKKSRIFRHASYLMNKIRFRTSGEYWEDVYSTGGDSGEGSFGRLAEFKAKVINDFIRKRSVTSVVEFGCGDGNQLSSYRMPRYIGLDISKTAIRKCIGRFGEDREKSFFLYDTGCFSDNSGLFRAELAMSIDVIYHLVEDETYETYMSHLMGAAERYIIIYSSDFDHSYGKRKHVRHRRFSRLIASRYPGWKLVKRIEGIKGTAAHFFIYERSTSP